MTHDQLLEASFEDAMHNECHPHSRLEFLGDNIFNFTTYDSEMSELFASKALEVCAAISDGKTFNYIETPENHQWYLIMVNMPFFSEKIEWGTSVRGAWWIHNEITLETCGLDDGEKQVLDPTFTREEWIEFVAALIRFSAITKPIETVTP